MSNFSRDFLRGIGASLNPQAAAAIERGRAREAQATQFQQQQELSANQRAEDQRRQDARFKVTDKLTRDKLALSGQAKNKSVFWNVYNEKSNETYIADLNDPDTRNDLKNRRIQKVSKTQEVGADGSFSLGAKAKDSLIAKHMESKSNLYQGVQRADDAIKLVSSDDFRGGIIGSGFGLVNSFNSQIRQSFGGDSILGEDGQIDESKLDLSPKLLSQLRRSAINKAEFTAATSELAYTMAKILDPGGRVTDKDYLAARDMVAAGSDKVQLVTMIRGYQRRALRSFNDSVKINNEFLPKGMDKIRPTKMLDIFSQPSQQQPQQPQLQTGHQNQSGQQQPPEGSTVIQNGITYKVTNGQYIEVK